MGFFKKTLQVAAYLGLLAVVINGANSVRDFYRPEKIEPMTLQRRATHRVKYSGGLCTATAIGPHALLTATHCKHGKVDTIHLDLATGDVHIEKVLTDGRDHDVYLVDAMFTNFVPYKVRPTKMGEHAYMYGNGGGQYPSRRLDGVRVAWDDPSDLDADAQIVHYSMPVIPGDSGSAVFNDDGTIGAVTTYLHDTEKSALWGLITEPTTTVDFVPAFTIDQINDALNFEPRAYEPPVKSEMTRLPRFNPLFFLGPQE